MPDGIFVPFFFVAVSIIELILLFKCISKLGDLSFRIGRIEGILNNAAARQAA